MYGSICFSLIMNWGQYAPCDEMDQMPKWPGQWQEFRELLGRPVDSPVVRDFVARNRLLHTTKGSSGIYSLRGKLPFSVLYSGNKISRVAVIVDRSVDAEDKGPLIKGDLPLGLNRDDLPEDVIRKLGKPAHRPERDYLSYKKPNLVISFDRRTHRLQEIDLDSEQ